MIQESYLSKFLLVSLHFYLNFMPFRCRLNAQADNGTAMYGSAVISCTIVLYNVFLKLTIIPFLQKTPPARSADHPHPLAQITVPMSTGADFCG